MTECQQCGTQTHNKKFCSNKCCTDSYRVEPNSICPFCKKPFYRRAKWIRDGKRTHCSNECRRKSKTWHRNVCQIESCGRVFRVSPSQKSRKYCSKECYWKSMTTLVFCKFCGKEITERIQRRNLYCNRECAGKARRRLKPCKKCGKEFWPGRQDSRYCSPECKSKRFVPKTSNCSWCGEEYASARRYAGVCSMSCHRMQQLYGNVNLRQLNMPVCEVYISNDGQPIWLPLTVKEIEATLYLHKRRLPTEDIVQHIKRWRAMRANWKREMRQARDEGRPHLIT